MGSLWLFELRMWPLIQGIQLVKLISGQALYMRSTQKQETTFCLQSTGDSTTLSLLRRLLSISLLTMAQETGSSRSQTWIHQIMLNLSSSLWLFSAREQENTWKMISTGLSLSMIDSCLTGLCGMAGILIFLTRLILTTLLVLQDETSKKKLAQNSDHEPEKNLQRMNNRENCRMILPKLIVIGSDMTISWDYLTLLINNLAKQTFRAIFLQTCLHSSSPLHFSQVRHKLTRQ